MPSRIKFDGFNWSRSDRAVVLPAEYGDRPGHVVFGRACGKNTPGAIRTKACWAGDSPFGDEAESVEGGLKIHPVYARKVECSGYGLTNLMYSRDGYAYLARDGQVFVRRCPRPKDKPVTRAELKEVLRKRLQPFTESGLNPDDEMVVSSLVDYIIPLAAWIRDGKVSFANEKR